MAPAHGSFTAACAGTVVLVLAAESAQSLALGLTHHMCLCVCIGVWGVFECACAHGSLRVCEVPLL